MAKQESIKKNYIYNTLYQILTMITPLITAPYISRVLGSGGVGIYSFTNSVASYFTLFAGLGTWAYGQREIAMHRDSKKESSRLFWEIELLSIATTGVTLAVWIVLILVSGRYSAYYAVLTASIVAVAFDISWYFGGFEKFKYIVIRNTIVKLLGIVLLFLFVRDKDDTLLYVAIMAFTGLLGNISMWTYLPKMLYHVDRKSIHPFRVHLKQTFVYFIPTIATSVYTVLDKTMIGLITKSDSENGYYEQATKIIRMIESGLFSLNTVMRARQSYLFGEGKLDEIREKIGKSFDFLFALAIPSMFGLISIASNFVPWFFGIGYEPVVLLMCLMSPLPLIISISNILDFQYLTPSGQKGKSTKGVVAGAIVNVCFNAILIPKYGAAGATVGSIAAELTISCIFVHMSKGFISWRQIFRISWKKVIASVVFAIAIMQIGKGYSGLVLITVIQILLGIAIYAVILLAMKDSFAEAALSYIKKGKIKKRG